ncbi:MAG TPA: hypothetical protein VGD27_02775, partial [Longimicrobiales bacterium]
MKRRSPSEDRRVNLGACRTRYKATEARLLHLIQASETRLFPRRSDAMTQQDTGQRRRADDFKAHPENTETLDPAV